MPGFYRVILADNYSVLRKELKGILERSGNFQVVGEAANGFDILNLLAHGIVPDALVLDLMMPKMTGIEALKEIRQRGYTFKILVLTMHKEPDLLCSSFLAGADGYMLKDGITAELVEALDTVLDGKVYLSPLIKCELPETCRISPWAGHVPPSGIEHCK